MLLAHVLPYLVGDVPFQGDDGADRVTGRDSVRRPRLDGNVIHGRGGQQGRAMDKRGGVVLILAGIRGARVARRPAYKGVAPDLVEVIRLHVDEHSGPGAFVVDSISNQGGSYTCADADGRIPVPGICKAV